MKNKKITLIIASFLLIGIVVSGFVSADRELSNMEGITIDNFTAGTEVQANFSYDYIGGVAKNVDDSPLIIQLNISSEDEVNYPVWKGDFEIEGYIERSRLFGLLLETIPFECSDVSEQKIEHPLGSEPVTAQNGTFYCYNHSADLDLDRQDNVFLNIKSEPALWPGDYTLNAKMFYLNDTYSPEVEILNKEDFQNIYYTRGDEIDKIRVNITDINLNTNSLRGTVITPERDFTNFIWSESVTEELFYFTREIPGNMPEGDWELRIIAEDIFGSLGYDNMTLKIDNTPPEIELIEPSINWSVYNDTLTIKANITDEKAGVDQESVKYRLRETHLSENGTITFICPETGEGSPECVNTGWQKMNYKSSSELFEKEVDVSELNSSGYWLEINASDILGNYAVL